MRKQARETSVHSRLGSLAQLRVPVLLAGILAALTLPGCLYRATGPQFPYVKPADSAPVVDPARVRLVSRMEGLEMEMQNLRNMIERLRGTQGTSETVRDLQQRVSFIERQLGIEGSRPVPDSIETSPEAVDESLGPAPGGDAIPLQRPDPEFTTTSQPAGGRPDPVEDDQIVHVTSPDLEEDKDLYKRAYDALSSARDQEAVNLFRKFLEKYPDSEHAADANYWLGEALFNKGLYDEAVLQFGKAIKDYPGAKKTASAYFKQGSAFEKMGDEKSALVVFERLVKKYPHTPQARLANKRVKALKSDSGEKPRD